MLQSSRENRPQKPPRGGTPAVRQLPSPHGPLSGLNEAPIVSSGITQYAASSLWLLHPIVTVATISSDRCRIVAPIERRLRVKAILSIEVVVLQRRLSYENESFGVD